MEPNDAEKDIVYRDQVKYYRKFEELGLGIPVERQKLYKIIM